jgi:predicted ester cyclase
MFSKEKRKQAKANKAYLKEHIKPRPTHETTMARKAHVQERQDIIDQREEPIRKRLKAIHAGEEIGDVAQMASGLLYIGNLSNIFFQVQDTMSIPDKCMMRWTVHGVHDKEFLGMPPTGREVRFSGVTVSYITTTTVDVGQEDERHETRVTQEYHYWDMVALLQQIQA